MTPPWFLLAFSAVVSTAFGVPAHRTSGGMIRTWRARACFSSTTHHARQLQKGTRRALSSSASDTDGEPIISSPSCYERLGSPKHVLAPMVAQSDLPFRLMCEQLHGVDLSYTQMIHATNFVDQNGETFRANHLDVYPQSIVRDVLLGREDRRKLLVRPSQANALKGMGESEIEEARRRILASIAESQRTSEPTIEVKPTVVQIAAHDPNVAVEAAMMILERSGSLDADTTPVAAIDLNLGCPQSIARKGRYGSFLHDESPETTYKVLAALRKNLPPEIGVTAKIRLPPTLDQAAAGKLGSLGPPQTIDDRISCLIDCGVDLITVHGRTRFENKVTVGAADWDAVRQCVDTARSYSGDGRYPIFANGGIELYEDVRRCLDETSASGVMSSESLLEFPGLFSSSATEPSTPTTAEDLLERQLGYAETYLDYATILPPIPGSLGTLGGSFNCIRSHLFKYLHRYFEETPDLRSWMGNQDLQTIKEAKELTSELRSRYANLDEEQLRAKKSWERSSSWYRRHRRRITDEATSTVSIEERKQLAKLRIAKLKDERMRRSMVSN